MDSHLSNAEADSNTSPTQRFNFERPEDHDHEYASETESVSSNVSESSKSESQTRLAGLGEPSSDCHSVSDDDSGSDRSDSDDGRGSRDRGSNFMTTSIDIPEFDPELLQGEYMSQNLFEADDRSQHSDGPDECEIVGIVHSDPMCSRAAEIDGENFDLTGIENGSTLDPICVDDSNSARQSGTPTRAGGRPRHPRSLESSGPRARNRERENDDCIMGPIHWNKRSPQFPLDYYRSNKKISNAYSIIDESFGELSSIEDIEFLFKCPICYSTITRLRSGKVPNENDKVIYSTKCGHLFCYECIESVKSRRECSICRKQVRDKHQYHVVFP